MTKSDSPLESGSIYVSLADHDQTVVLRTDREDFESLELFDAIPRMTRKSKGRYEVPLNPLTAFALVCFLRKLPGVKARSGDVVFIKRKARIVSMPKAELSENKDRVIITIPALAPYRQPLIALGAYPNRDYTWSLPVEKALDVISLFDTVTARLPRLRVDPELSSIFTKPLPGFDGSINSLRSIPVSELHVVKVDNQRGYERKASKLTVEQKFAKLGVKSLYDLLFYVPYRHIDKSNPQNIEDLVIGETAVLDGVITSTATFSGAKAGGARFTIEDKTGKSISVSFFNQEWLLRKFKPGARVIITGKLKWYGKLMVAGSSIEFAEETANLPIVPVYRQSPSNGMTTYRILCAVRELLLRMGNKATLEPYFSEELFPDFFKTVHALHIPETVEEHAQARADMALRELFYMQMILLSEQDDSIESIPLSDTSAVDDFVRELPFSLTDGQADVIGRMKKAMANDKPMNVLLTADVGAGKTVCAQAAAMQAVGNGGQAVILAPTDVLAQQLYRSTCQHTSANVVLLSGSVPTAQQKDIKNQIADGTAQIIVGTQSLLSKSVRYHNLVFVAIDEQQKFGTEQREMLLRARSDGRQPHILSQTATPIPRSIAQLIYGSMELLELRDKPAGRLPIITEWVKANPNEFIHEKVNLVWDRVCQEAAEGKQTFVVAPLVEESSAVDTASVKTVADVLTKSTLGSLRIGMVHGKMKKAEQQEVVTKFRDKEYDVLVCSTVVEVGVDIPGATVVVVLSADRLGAASLHQVRGRVGRNSEQSYCFLVSEGQTDSAQERMMAMVSSNDGFEIAQADLKTRGEGTVLSTSQHGKNEMQFVSLLRDKDKITKACQLAKDVLASSHVDEALKDAQVMFS